jgi:iron complex outermembrane receptor protein
MTRLKKGLYRSFNKRSIVTSSVFLFLSAPLAAAASTQISMLADMSFEELANINITSVSKKSEPLADATASVFVITADDIRRSGAASLPEALRLAPNLQVAQSSGSGYAISARGFNGRNNSAPNKLLVLIDGRSVYTPLFSGVFWDAQDVMLEDIERIEVISGPGGTLWGVNAVNGVINVITRSSKDTQGILAAASGGRQGSNMAFRYGGKLGEDGSYRVYGKQSDRDNLYTANGTPVTDAWHKKQVGFRADVGHEGNRVTVLGNAYNGAIGQAAPGSISITGTTLALGTISISGLNLTSRWDHMLDDGSSFSLQAYYDQTTRDVPPTLAETLDIFDVQFQHSLKPIGMHTPVWGVNYRYGQDDVNNKTPIIAFLPAKVDQKWVSLFAQDEMALRDDLKFTLGIRAEHNPYTGVELLPSARLGWKVLPEHLLWTAVSRTVRAPSRFDRDLFLPTNVPPLTGGPDTVSEVANVYELGYRGQVGRNLTYSITRYKTYYDHLQTLKLYPNATAPTAIVFGNDMDGRANGLEMWGTYQAQTWWRLSAGFTGLKESLRLKPGGVDKSAPTASGKNPEHTWQLRSSFNLTPQHDFDLAVRHVSSLSSPDNIPSYTAIDARFGWKIQRNLELSVTGTNLFGSAHTEYGLAQYRAEIPSSVFVKLVWQQE